MPFWTFDNAGALVYVNEDGSTTPAADMPGGPPSPGGPVDQPGPMDPYAGAPEVDAISGVGAPIPPPGQPVDPYQGVAPTPGAPGPVPVGTSDKSSWRSNVSLDYSGFNPEALAQARTDYDVREAGVDLDAARSYQAGALPAYEAAQAQKAAIMSPEEAAKARPLVDLQAEMGDLQADQADKLAKRQEFMRIEEERATAAADLVTRRALAQYQAQAQQFANMRISAPELNMGPSLMAGLLIEGFLLPTGVNTGTTDLINRTLDRKLEANIAEVNRGAKAAGLFRDVYDATRQQSATELENRERLRGMFLARMKTEALAEMAKYDAPLARARGAQLIADIDAALVENLTKLEDTIRQRALVAKQQLVQMRGQDFDAAMERRRIGLGYAELNERGRQFDKTMEAAAAPKGGPALDPEMRKLAIYDPESHTLLGFGPDEVYTRQMRDRLNGLKLMQDALQEFQKLTEEIGPLYDSTGAQLYQDKDEARVRGAYSRYVSAKILLLSGKAATEQEAKRIQDQAAFARWAKSDVAGVLADEARSNERAIDADRANILKPEKLLGQGWEQGPWGGELTTRSGFGTSKAMDIEARVTVDPEAGHTESPAQTLIKGAYESGAHVEDRLIEALRTVREGKDPIDLAYVLADVDAFLEKEHENWGGTAITDPGGPIDRAIDRYVELTGRVPVGFRSPSVQYLIYGTDNPEVSYVRGGVIPAGAYRADEGTYRPAYRDRLAAGQVADVSRLGATEAARAVQDTGPGGGPILTGEMGDE